MKIRVHRFVLHGLPIQTHFGVLLHAVVILLDLVVLVTGEFSNDKLVKQSDVVVSLHVKYQTLIRVVSMQSVALSSRAQPCQRFA